MGESVALSLAWSQPADGSFGRGSCGAVVPMELALVFALYKRDGTRSVQMESVSESGLGLKCWVSRFRDGFTPSLPSRIHPFSIAFGS